MLMTQEQIDSLKNSIERNCRNCSHFVGSEHDYEEMVTYSACCSKKENVWNLKSFPFQKKQKCFQVDTRILEFKDNDLQVLDDKWFIVYSDEEEKTKVENEINYIIKERYWDLLTPDV